MKFIQFFENCDDFLETFEINHIWNSFSYHKQLKIFSTCSKRFGPYAGLTLVNTSPRNTKDVISRSRQWLFNDKMALSPLIDLKYKSQILSNFIIYGNESLELGSII